MLRFKNLKVKIDRAEVPVAVFGTGKKNIIMLPGVGDGLQTVEGKALFLGLSYRRLAKDFTVYTVSRRVPLSENQSTKDMADDLAAVMEKLGVEKASIIGVSMGGMIAQHFAAEYPEKTEKLVLVVTAPHPNETITKNVARWADLAKRADGPALMKDSVYNMYSDEYYKKNGWLTPVMGRIAVPKDFPRFVMMCKACREHDAFAVLGKITAPTLVIGGSADRTVGAEASAELAKKISGAKLYMYEGQRHALYDEAPDFIERVHKFLNE